MANRTLPLNPLDQNYNRKTWNLSANQTLNPELATPTIDDILERTQVYRIIGDVTATGFITFRAPENGAVSAATALAAAGTQTFDMNALVTGYLFPANVWLTSGAYLNVRTVFATITTPTALLGDAGDPDGLVTSSAIDSTGVKNTVAAAEYAKRVETAFVPLLTLGGATNLNLVTAGQIEIVIPYSAAPI